MEEQFASVNTPSERLTDREKIAVGKHLRKGVQVDRDTANEIVELLNCIFSDACGLKGLASAYLVEVIEPNDDYQTGLCRGAEALGDRIGRFSSYLLDLFTK